MQSLPPEWCNPKLNLHLPLESWLGGSWRITPLSSHLGPFPPGELLTIVANYLLNGMIFQVVPIHTQQQTLISPTKKHALWAQRTHLDCSTRTMVAQLLGSLQGNLLLVFGSCDRQLFHQQRSWNMNYQPKQGHYVFSKKFVRPWSFATFLHQVFFSPHKMGPIECSENQWRSWKTASGKKRWSDRDRTRIHQTPISRTDTISVLQGFGKHVPPLEKENSPESYIFLTKYVIYLFLRNVVILKWYSPYNLGSLFRTANRLSPGKKHRWVGWVLLLRLVGSYNLPSGKLT